MDPRRVQAFFASEHKLETGARACSQLKRLLAVLGYARWDYGFKHAEQWRGPESMWGFYDHYEFRGLQTVTREYGGLADVVTATTVNCGRALLGFLQDAHETLLVSPTRPKLAWLLAQAQAGGAGPVALERGLVHALGSEVWNQQQRGGVPGNNVTGFSSRYSASATLKVVQGAAEKSWLMRRFMHEVVWQSYHAKRTRPFQITPDGEFLHADFTPANVRPDDFIGPAWWEPWNKDELLQVRHNIVDYKLVPAVNAQFMVNAPMPSRGVERPFFRLMLEAALGGELPTERKCR
jgi:hypothetical protein